MSAFIRSGARHGRALRKLLADYPSGHDMNHAVAKRLEADGLVVILGESEPPARWTGRPPGPNRNLYGSLTPLGLKAAEAAARGDNPYMYDCEFKPEMLDLAVLEQAND